MDWTKRPYVRGSYSYPAPGSYPGGTSMREELANMKSRLEAAKS